MNTCQQPVIHLMHAYLDGDISRDEEQTLQEHLNACPQCQDMMEEFKMSEQLLHSASPIEAPVGFVSGVMTRLPKEKSQAGISRILRRHPFMAAAALFFLLMSATLFSNFSNNQQFSFTKQPNLVIEGETVVVPAGEIIKGDMVVKNGNIRIEGEVDGNVTVIRGSKYMASTAVVTGNIEEIDKAFDWLWYKIKELVKDVIPSKGIEPETE